MYRIKVYYNGPNENYRGASYIFNMMDVLSPANLFRDLHILSNLRQRMTEEQFPRLLRWCLGDSSQTNVI